MGVQMENSKIHYFEKNAEKHHREYINSHNNCILCQTVLELRHIRHDQSMLIKEEAYCPDCDMRTRAKEYTLQ